MHRFIIILLFLTSACVAEFPDQTAMDQVQYMLLALGIQSRNPDSVSSIVQWYKSDAINSYHGDPVSSWSDSSGNSNPAINATSAQQPVFHSNILNGYPAVYFDGTDDHLQSPDITLDTINVFAVTRATLNWDPAWSGSYNIDQILSKGSAGNRSNIIWYRWQEDSSIPKLRFQHTISRDGSEQVRNTVYVDNDSWHFFESSYDSSYGRFYLAGNLLSTTELKTGILHNSPAGFNLGSFNGANGFFQGYIAEIIIYSRVLNESERQGISCYLIKKYALVNSQLCI